MSIQVRWTWDRSAGLYDIAGEGDGVDVRVRTANLSYASELTRVLLQSSPAAFVSEPAPVPDESILPPAAVADADDNVSGLLAGSAGLP